MTKEEKLKQCRYYHGEEKHTNLNPDNKSFWCYEHRWTEIEEGNKLEQDMIREYIADGLEHFSEDDGIDISMKALLFNRYTHWGSYHTNEDFMKFYLEEYLGKRTKR